MYNCRLPTYCFELSFARGNALSAGAFFCASCNYVTRINTGIISKVCLRMSRWPPALQRESPWNGRILIEEETVPVVWTWWARSACLAMTKCGGCLGRWRNIYGKSGMCKKMSIESFKMIQDTCHLVIKILWIGWVSHRTQSETPLDGSDTRFSWVQTRWISSTWDLNSSHLAFQSCKDSWSNRFSDLEYLFEFDWIPAVLKNQKRIFPIRWSRIDCDPPFSSLELVRESSRFGCLSGASALNHFGLIAVYEIFNKFGQKWMEGGRQEEMRRASAQPTSCAAQHNLCLIFLCRLAHFHWELIGPVCSTFENNARCKKRTLCWQNSGGFFLSARSC